MKLGFTNTNNSDYQIFHSDRLTTGGGVLVEVHSCIPARQLYTRSSESVIVELDITPKTVICCIYIRPSCSDEFSVAIDTLNSIQADHDVILTGDFNVPDIDCLTLTAPTIRSSSLCDIFLVNLVTQPTHQSGNILDLVLSNSPDRISNLAIGIPNTTLSSDHSVIAFDINSGNPVQQMASKLIFCYSNANLVHLDCYLLDVDYNPIYTCLDVNVSNQFLKSVLTQACQFYIPILQIPSYSSPKCFDAKIRHHLKKIHTMKRQLNKKHSNNRVLKLNTLEADLE